MLSADEFAAGAQSLAHAWQHHCRTEHSWQWLQSRAPFSNAMGGGYLALEGIPMLGNRERGEDATLATDVESLEEQQDEASLLPTASLPNRFDFHIVYHVSYRVPVLYFNGYDAGGSLLGLTDIEAHIQLHSYGQGPALGAEQPFISSEEHPILQRPFFLLHPCRTADVMALMLAPQAEPGHVEGDCEPGLALERSTTDGVLASREETTGIPIGEREHPAADWNVAIVHIVKGEEHRKKAASETSTTISIREPGSPPFPVRQTEGAQGLHARADERGSTGAVSPQLRYLLAWFSVLGPSVGLRLPQELWPLLGARKILEKKHGG